MSSIRHQQRHRGGEGDQEQAGGGRQPASNRAKIQSEITNSSASWQHLEYSVFSGENWLSVDSSEPDYNPVEDGRCLVLAERRRGVDRHHLDGA